MSREEASPSLCEIKQSQSHTKLKAPQRTERARESQSSWASADDDDTAGSALRAQYIGHGERCGECGGAQSENIAAGDHGALPQGSISEK